MTATTYLSHNHSHHHNHHNNNNNPNELKSPRSPLLDDIIMSEIDLSHHSLSHQPALSSSSSSDHSHQHHIDHNSDVFDEDDLPPPGPPLFFRQNAYYNEHSSTNARINRGEIILPMN